MTNSSAKPTPEIHRRDVSRRALSLSGPTECGPRRCSIAPILDECGFDRINLISGSAFETAIVYLYEDPWERLHQLRKRIKKTDTIILVRGRNLFGWKRYSDDVVEPVHAELKQIGIDWVLIFDALT